VGITRHTVTNRNMKTKHISKQMTYLQKTIEHTITINGKEVLVYERLLDSIYGDNEYDIEIFEEDKEKLTDDELEYLEDNLPDIISK